MSVFYQLNNIPAFKNPVITIGSFDGVHHGHKVILTEVVNAAKKVGGESILITFEPHPRKIIQPDVPLGLLTSLEQKIELITRLGIDHIVVVPFTRDFSMLSAGEYVSKFLIETFKPQAIIIGYDHHFGHSREGNIDLLKQLAPANVQIIEISAQLIEQAAVSSTKVRKAIASGNVAEATEMLGRPFSFSATVVHGNKIGRTIGYPTANLKSNYPDLLLPGIGIYAVIVTWRNKCYKGMMSIGYRPTVTAEQTITYEVNILDFNEDLYGQTLTVHFIEYLRGEEKFDGLNALVEQIKMDENATRKALQDHPLLSC